MRRQEWAKRPRRESVRKRIGKRKAEAIWLRDGGCCVYCQSPGQCFDHLIPRVRGGHDDATNLVVACTSCNSGRKDLPLFAWTRTLLHTLGLVVCPRRIFRGAKCVS